MKKAILVIVFLLLAMAGCSGKNTKDSPKEHADKKPVENIELWKALLKQTAQHDVTFHKVKGHADNPHNNRADQLATAQIQLAKQAK